MSNVFHFIIIFQQICGSKKSKKKLRKPSKNYFGKSEYKSITKINKNLHIACTTATLNKTLSYVHCKK